MYLTVNKADDSQGNADKRTKEGSSIDPRSDGVVEMLAPIR